MRDISTAKTKSKTVKAITQGLFAPVATMSEGFTLASVMPAAPVTGFEEVSEPKIPSVTTTLL